MARGPEPEVKLKTNLAATARIGVFASLALLVIGFIWMQSTMIAGAVIAQGQAVVSGKPKEVQTLDGGIVSEIFVEDGDSVRAGDVLVKLDPTLLLINQNMYRDRLAEVTARASRLQAEYTGDPKITPMAPLAQLKGVEIERNYVGQQAVFQARQDVQAGKKEQLDERILQFGNQTDGLTGQITSVDDQLGYVKKELDSLQSLNSQGLARESQVLELQRTQSGLLGQKSQLQSDLARIKNSIRDTQLEILQSNRTFKESVVTELREATATRDELILQLTTVEKQLERVDILAPTDGIIHEMQVFTVGGVVAPQATILQIIPQSKGVEFELRVDPKAIDQIFVGQTAKVSFPGFDMRTIPEIFGTLSEVPPSTVTDPTTGQSYYRVGLSVPPEGLALLGNVDLIPGMPIEAFLETGERSILSYLTKPLVDQLSRAFREG